MFTPVDIQNRLKQKPFVPVRIVTSSGQQYDVYHPDMALVGQRDLTIGTAVTIGSTIYDQVARVSILHVTDLQDLPALSEAKSQNGQVTG